MINLTSDPTSGGLIATGTRHDLDAVRDALTRSYHEQVIVPLLRTEYA